MTEFNKSKNIGWKVKFIILYLWSGKSFSYLLKWNIKKIDKDMQCFSTKFAFILNRILNFVEINF